MMSDNDYKIYGVIIEHKAERPLIMEGPPATYSEAKSRMSALLARPEIIRVAMFEAVYVTGNETLLPKKSGEI